MSYSFVEHVFPTLDHWRSGKFMKEKNYYCVITQLCKENVLEFIAIRLFRSRNRIIIIVTSG